MDLSPYSPAGRDVASHLHKKLRIDSPTPSHLEPWSSAVNQQAQVHRRNCFLKDLQGIVKNRAGNLTGELDACSFVELFSQTNVLTILFQLFDSEAVGQISQEFFLCLLRNNFKGEESHSFVDLLEAVAYIIAGDNALTESNFVRMFSSKGVLKKFYFIITNGVERITTEDLMSFITELTYVRRSTELTEADLQQVEKLFRMHASPNGQVCLEAFARMVSTKQPFFVERVFQIFDKDGSGGISLAEFIQSIQQYCSKSIDDKVRFMFQIYDVNGDGLIQLGELKQVLNSFAAENQIVFDCEQLDELTEALFEDANPAGLDGITYEQLKDQLEKHEGLLESLSVNIDRWLLPSSSRNPSKVPYKLSVNYIRNNLSYLIFMYFFWAIDIGLFVCRALEISEENPLPLDRIIFQVLARASGRALAFNSILVLILMLRHCITFLRVHGLAWIFPLDRHVSLHVVCGVSIVFFGLVHTAAHVLNFCVILSRNQEMCFAYLFTMNGNDFGLIAGFASLSGWALLFAVLAMSLGSLPGVRRSGYFEVFYWSHLLHVPYWILLVLHCPDFWKWFVVPGTVYVFERYIRLHRLFTGQGRTLVSTAILLPSRVTHLVIRRPRNFHFHPGDYVFVNIPTIASFEWHPFTISSAPEQTDFIWLHVRGVGGWTNKLYDYFDKLHAEMRNGGQTCDSCDYSTGSTLDYRSCDSFRTVGKSNRLRRTASATDSDDIGRHYANNRKPPVFLDAPEAIATQGRNDCVSDPETARLFPSTNHSYGTVRFNDPRKTDPLSRPLEVIIDGPYGTPSSHIFHAEHAVLIAAGIGVTPFASILQSIMHRYWNSRQNCPSCHYSWKCGVPRAVMNLKKVDFFWINREQRSFEWFVRLLSQLEIEQTEKTGMLERFLDMHMYITSALQRTDVKAVGLQMALDLLYSKNKRDMITGLKSRTKAGRPNWNKVFRKLQCEGKGKITVFYCGPLQLGSELAKKCAEFGFDYRKEIF